MNNTPENVDKITGFFERILVEDHTKIVLHEAVEALGNINNDKALQLIELFKDEKDGILFETCFLT